MSFYQTLSQYYDNIFPRNPVQLDFLKDHAKDKSTILDIAAGSGNQAVELAKQGAKVTAIDSDDEMVKKIQMKSEAAQLDILAKRMDMRTIDQLNEQTYGLITCIGNSIVHLQSFAEILETIRKMYHLLAGKGIMIIQTVNFDRILKHRITSLPIIERKEEGVTFIRTYDHDGDRIKFNGELIITKDSKKETLTNSVFLYPLTSTELIEIIDTCGFTSYQLYGDFKRSEFTEESPALIVVAQK